MDDDATFPRASLTHLNDDPLLRRLSEWLSATGSPAYLVGGAVRDCLLGCLTAGDGRGESSGYALDLDILVPSGGVRTARHLADRLGGAFYILDAARDVGRVVLGKAAAGGQRIVDVAAFQGATLLDDLRGRDFTLNAMAVDITRQPLTLIDPTGGLADLRAGCLRAVDTDSLQRDAVRTLRAVRLAAQFGFEIEPATLRLIEAAAPALNGVSAERVRDELVKILALPNAAASVQRLDQLGPLGVVLPELMPLKGLPQPHRVVDGFQHTLEVVAALERRLPPGEGGTTLSRPWWERLEAHLQTVLPGGHSRRLLLTLAGLLHDIGKPATLSRDPDGAPHFYGHEGVGAELAAAVLTRLRFSRPATEWVATIVRHHLRPLLLSREPVLTRRAVHRFFRDAGAAGVDVVLLALADHPPESALPEGEDGADAALARTADTLLEAWFECHAEVVAPPPLLSGGELVRQYGLAPSPQIGQLQRDLQEAQAAGEVTTTDQARAWVIEHLSQGRGVR